MNLSDRVLGFGTAGVEIDTGTCRNVQPWQQLILSVCVCVELVVVVGACTLIGEEVWVVIIVVVQPVLLLVLLALYPVVAIVADVVV